MASFVEDLWNAIFTPGPTPPLLMATNATFLALQAILLVLLIATYSIHFVVLSVLSGGLWFSINWFAREVMTEQAKKNAEEHRNARSNRSRVSAADGDLASDEMDSDDSGNTEVDEASPSQTSISATQIPPRSTSLKADQRHVQATTGAEVTALSTGEGEAVKQRRNMTDSVGDLSTDSEWEKIDE